MRMFSYKRWQNISIPLAHLFLVITTELYAILSAHKITAYNELHSILVLTDSIQAIQNLYINHRSEHLLAKTILHHTEKNYLK